MLVIKSDGSKVTIDLDKIHIMVHKACKGIAGVSESLVEMNSGLQFYDGIGPKDIQQISELVAEWSHFAMNFFRCIKTIIVWNTETSIQYQVEGLNNLSTTL